MSIETQVLLAGLGSAILLTLGVWLARIWQSRQAAPFRQTDPLKESDQGVLTIMLDKGANFSERREVNFYFYGPAERIEELKIEIEQLGFTTRPTTMQPGLIATVNIDFNENWLSGMIDTFEDLARKFGIEFDGWEASVPEAQH